MSFRSLIKYYYFNYSPFVAGSFDYYGTTVYFPKNSYIFKLACSQGIYEYNNLNTIISLLKPKSTFIDIGANIGLMSVPILKSCPDIDVISVEPSVNSLPYLKKTHNNSIYKNRWKIVDRAMGTDEGEVEMSVLINNDMGAFDSISKNNTDRIGSSTSQKVKISCLDNLWLNMNKPLISFIKIDVEGYEMNVLNGSKKCITENKPSILLEWNKKHLASFNFNIDIILKFAEDLNYRLLAIPNLQVVESLTMLKILMTQTESYLLIPNN